MKELVILTGAGISAESGIPTFRGKDGYWTVGSKHYHPTEMATNLAFQQMPEEVWAWYLHRMEICEKAFPNKGHKLIVDLEEKYADKFQLITQNVDNLHIRAGNKSEYCYEIHGNITKMRCSEDCNLKLLNTPKDRSIETILKLKCADCSAILRPHVLWFDEYYNDELFFFRQSLKIASNCKTLITIGTSAATNLPNQFVRSAYHAKVAIYDINPEENTFSDYAKSSGGEYLKMTASKGLEYLLSEQII